MGPSKRIELRRVAFTGKPVEYAAWRRSMADQGYTLNDLDHRGTDDDGQYGHLFEATKTVIVLDESASKLGGTGP